MSTVGDYDDDDDDDDDDVWFSSLWRIHLVAFWNLTARWHYVSCTLDLFKLTVSALKWNTTEKKHVTFHESLFL